MNRLLEGDVGSGKTVVALTGAIQVAKAGYQSVFMAPTEVLAQQHFKTITSLVGDMARVALLTSSTEEKAKVKKAAKPKKKAGKRKPNAAFMKELTPSVKLAAIVGSAPLARTQVVKKMWVYIKKHKLQNPKNMRNIKADPALKAVFKGKGVVSMFEMTKLVSKHLS